MPVLEMWFPSDTNQSHFTDAVEKLGLEVQPTEAGCLIVEVENLSMDDPVMQLMQDNGGRLAGQRPQGAG